MADQTTGKVPRIRFKAYSEPWAEEKIGDVLAEKRRPIVLEDDKRYELITVKRRNEGVVSRGHLLGREILVKNYAELKAGDFVISKRQVVHGATGIVPPTLDGAIVSNEYLTAVDGERLLTEFLTIVASLPAMRKKFFLSSYGVDIEKLLFDADDWKKRDVMLPDVQEQSRIAQFFQNLNQLIALHKSKHGKLLALKTAMLQKMIPQSGATTPEVRFKGFNGNWRRTKLGKISESYSGGTPAVGNAEFYGGTIPFIRSGEINAKSTELTITYEGLRKSAAKSVRVGDILYALYGATSGEVGISKISGAINQAVLAIKVFEGHDSRFVAIWLRNKKSEILRTYLQGGQGNLSGGIVRSLEIDTPCAEEQRKIGTYFHTLDALIEKHASQIQKLQQIKSACLDGMFV